MRYLLGLPSMEARHKMEQVKACLNAMQSPKNPLHDSVKEEKGCRLARSMSWMGQAEQSIQHVCGPAELKQVRDCNTHKKQNQKTTVQLSSSPTTRLCLSDNLGTHCQEWPAGKANTDVQILVEAHRKPCDIGIYTDGSVTRDCSS